MAADKKKEKKKKKKQKQSNQRFRKNDSVYLAEMLYRVLVGP